MTTAASGRETPCPPPGHAPAQFRQVHYGDHRGEGQRLVEQQQDGDEKQLDAATVARDFLAQWQRVEPASGGSSS